MTDVSAPPSPDAVPAPLRPGLIRDPREIPVVAVDDHLPPVARERLTVDALIRRFQSPPIWTPEFSGDGRPTLDRPVRPAAVLLALTPRESGLHVLLTRRTEHLRDHGGQVSFPGGRAEDDDPDAAATALREAEEEVGMAPERVRVIGELPSYRTITAYQVTPVVALVEPDVTLRLDAFEVAEAFEVPLDFLMTPAHHRRHAVELGGQRRQFLSMPWAGVGSLGEPREYFIWGATAAMLRNFYRFLAAD